MHIPSAARHPRPGTTTIARVAALAFALPSVFACATARTPAPASTPTGVDAASALNTRRLISETRFRIDSGVRHGSFAPLLAVVDDSTRIVTPSGRVLNGTDDIAAALGAAAAGARIAGIQLSAPRYETCVDGGIEWGARYFVPMTRDGVADTLRGPFAVRWIVEGDGSVHMRQLMLGRAALDAGFRRPCITTLTDVVRNWSALGNGRLMLWVPVMVDRWATVDDLTDRFQSDGYGPGRLGNLSNYRGTVERQPPFTVSALGIRYQVRAPISVDLLGSTEAVGSVFQAYNPSTTTHVSITHEGRYVGGMIAGIWRYLRLGVGPLVVMNEWSERESTIEQDPVSGSWLREGTPTEQQWSSTDLGMLAHGSVIAPLSSALSIEGFALYRGLASSEIRATPRRRALRADVGGLGLGVALGVRF